MDSTTLQFTLASIDWARHRFVLYGMPLIQILW